LATDPIIFSDPKWDIDAANRGSIEFHKKYGFIEKGYLREVGYKFDQWLDVVYMQLILEEEV
jgi:L-amino acid N-acyltransferase YncA